jgi:hypothetical protein
MKKFKVFALRGSPAIIAGGKSGNTSMSQQVKQVLLLTVCMALGLGSFACNESPSFENEQIPGQYEQTVDGIVFKYSLLNEQGKPANKFKQGEDFSCHFTMTNKNGPDDLVFWHTLPCSLIGAGLWNIQAEDGEVRRLENWGVNCTAVLMTLPFYGSHNHYEFTFSSAAGNGTFDPDLLTPGNYYIDFAYKFEFMKEGRIPLNVCTQPIRFNLQFIID